MKKLAPLSKSGPPSTTAEPTSVRLISAERAVAQMRADSPEFREAYDALGRVEWGAAPAPEKL